MKLNTFRTFLVLLMPALFISSFIFWNINGQKSPEFIFNVRVPILPEKDETQESYYRRFRKRLFPQIEVPEPISQALPNDHTFLTVFIGKNRKLKINSQEIGTLENPFPLSEKLDEIFRQREEFGVFEPQGDKIVKAVAIQSSRSVKYGEVVKLIDVVKAKGANPVVLQIDDLPE